MSYLTEKARCTQPYVPGEQPKDGKGYIKFNTNENLTLPRFNGHEEVLNYAAKLSFSN